MEFIVILYCLIFKQSRNNTILENVRRKTFDLIYFMLLQTSSETYERVTSNIAYLTKKNNVRLLNKILRRIRKMISPFTTSKSINARGCRLPVRECLQSVVLIGLTYSSKLKLLRVACELWVLFPCSPQSLWYLTSLFWGILFFRDLDCGLPILCTGITPATYRGTHVIKWVKVREHMFILFIHGWVVSCGTCLGYCYSRSVIRCVSLSIRNLVFTHNCLTRMPAVYTIHTIRSTQVALHFSFADGLNEK